MVRAPIEALAGYFADAASVDPISALLLVVGTVLIVASSLVLAWLAVGALLDSVRRAVGYSAS